jgi:hypothetical protein
MTEAATLPTPVRAQTIEDLKRGCVLENQGIVDPTLLIVMGLDPHNTEKAVVYRHYDLHTQYTFNVSSLLNPMRFKLFSPQNPTETSFGLYTAKSANNLAEKLLEEMTGFQRVAALLVEATYAGIHNTLHPSRR